jgi:hypothetical protein
MRMLYRSNSNSERAAEVRRKDFKRKVKVVKNNINWLRKEEILTQTQMNKVSLATEKKIIRCFINLNPITL